MDTVLNKYNLNVKVPVGNKSIISFFPARWNTTEAFFSDLGLPNLPPPLIPFGGNFFSGPLPRDSVSGSSSSSFSDGFTDSQRLIALAALINPLR